MAKFIKIRTDNSGIVLEFVEGDKNISINLPDEDIVSMHEALESYIYEEEHEVAMQGEDEEDEDEDGE